MSLFPFLKKEKRDVNKNKVFKEYAWDFDKNKLILKDGRPVVLEREKAIEVWIYKALKTKRYKYPIYSWNYGSEVEDVIGKNLPLPILESEIKNDIKETLKQNKHIKDVYDFDVSIIRDKATVKFKVKTTYGEVDMVV